jgi:hypothetical protein
MVQEGQTILVQEYMENGDLFHAIAEDSAAQRFGWYRQRLPTGRLAPATGMARRIALDIARGLFFLHSRKCALAFFAARNPIGNSRESRGLP